MSLSVSICGGSRLVQDLLSTALDEHRVEVDATTAGDCDVVVWVADGPGQPPAAAGHRPTLVLASPTHPALTGGPGPESGWSLVAMDVSPAALRAAVELTASGSTVISPRAKEGVTVSRRSAAAELTPRELEVLQALARGDATKNIGRQLNLSTKTVEVHKANLFKKLGVRTTSEAVSVALTTGVLADGAPEGP